jgi:uncharacterized protein YndB with AHSA1/START domain
MSSYAAHCRSGQDEVWRAWSESDLIKQWWDPNGFSCPMADVDLSVGGRTFVAMRAPTEFGGGDLYSRKMRL